jgi:glycosyltransferase involved in cell wall biosynthesis
MPRFSDLRILMTADAVGGVWTYATALASAFASRGADVQLVIQGPAPTDAQRSMVSQTAVRLVESPLALEWQDPAGDSMEAARQFYAALEAKLRPDIVHLNSFREATFDWHCPVLVAAHSCVNSWGIACEDTAWLSDRRWRSYTRHVAAGLDQATAWVCPTCAFRDMVLDLYQPRAPGFVVWNGSPRQTDGFCRKEPMILAAGRMWDAAKNLAALEQAAEGLEWPVLVAGSTVDIASDPAIHQLGVVSHAELSQLMRRAAIFASPARYEPFGLSVLEAAAAGCALVLADIPTFRELWNDAALFVDPTDAHALHRALADLCADPAQCTRLQDAARARSRRYALRRMIDSYVALCQSLLAPDTRPMAAPGIEVFA